ncbi:hypothetical protein FJT64_020252 [Amphibalanus amphitrite]|uniref:Uncharacterized protein n=1 Tax=Amphibalanus amphitrite TaxID=1232801 RepID=A0A6A4WNY2_AMPAM|nr:hypothetical protein FJT64_020252 [Amphibalanus amphitrite]
MRERDLADGERRERPADELASQRYRLCRNRVKSAQLHAKSAFFLSSFRRPRRTTWTDIRRFLISPRTATPSTSSAPSGTDWADSLNRYFAAVGPRVAAALEEAQRVVAPLSPRPTRVVSGAFRVRPVTLPELSAAIQRMSTSRASGDDGVTIGMLRMTFPVIGPHLLNIINASLVSGRPLIYISADYTEQTEETEALDNESVSGRTEDAASEDRQFWLGIWLL